MSALPNSVGIPHRQAIRNYAHLPDPEKQTEPKPEQASPKRTPRPKAPKPDKPARTPRSQARAASPSQGLKQTDIVAFNQDAEVAFVALISGILREDGQLSYREAIQEAAFELNVSTETAKRYLVKHSARRAEFCLTGKSITLRVRK